MEAMLAVSSRTTVRPGSLNTSRGGMGSSSTNGVSGCFSDGINETRAAGPAAAGGWHGATIR